MGNVSGVAELKRREDFVHDGFNVRYGEIYGFVADYAQQVASASFNDEVNSVIFYKTVEKLGWTIFIAGTLRMFGWFCKESSVKNFSSRMYSIVIPYILYDWFSCLLTFMTTSRFCFLSFYCVH